MRSRKPKKKQSAPTEAASDKSPERKEKKATRPRQERLKRSALLLAGVVVTVVFYVWTRPPHRSVRLSSLQPMLSSPEFDMHYKHRSHWGTYRPGAYFGLKTREEFPMIAGLAWLDPSWYQNVHKIRHLARESDGLGSYGWLRHDGETFGVQEIIDYPYNITTSWVKDYDKDSDLGGDWSTRISVQPVHGHSGQNISLFFYFADESGPGHPEQIPLDWEIPIENKLSDTGRKLLKGSHGKSDWSLFVQSSSLDKMQIRSAVRPEENFHNITEQLQVYLYETLAVQWTNVQPDYSRLKLHLPEPDVWWESSTMTPNFATFGVEFPVPFELEFVFLSGPNRKTSHVTSSEESRFQLLTGKSLTLKIKQKIAEFDRKFRRVFGGSGAEKYVQEVAKRTLSNLLGGIGYFYGSSVVGLGNKPPEDKEKLLPYGPGALLTAVPSRSFFPRGFLWDEGFHQLLVRKWDPRLSRDIISHWLDRMNIDGWIPREQILGEEAEARVPEEFIVQRPDVLNPPTFFLPLMEMAQELLDGRLQKKEAERVSNFLTTAWPRLQKWLSYLMSSQQGALKTSFRWHARDETTDKELNPRTLDSGLDDYPRSSHPSTTERHLDLRCWIAYAMESMSSIGEAIQADKKDIEWYKQQSAELRDIQILDVLHFDSESGHYSDYGHHTEHVRLKWVQSELSQQDRVLKRVGRQPKPGYVPHFGYVSLFPFLLQIFKPDHPAVEQTIDEIRDPELLWTDYGLRSLSKSSSLYNTSNTEHDPPYWRGAIWINMNFMAIQALKHYSIVDGPYMQKAKATFSALKKNIVKNIVAEYKRTGYIWEQYDDFTGMGKRSHPFTGWSSLFVLMMED